MSRQSDPILLAEDDENDIGLLRLALARSGIVNPLYVVRDGEECIAYLEGGGMFSDRTQYPLPILLLLDLAMPRKTGFDVLDWIRRHPTLNRLRVVVLTMSRNIQDVNRAYDLGANSFLVKTMDVRDFAEQLQGIRNHWLAMSRPPDIKRSDAAAPEATKHPQPPT